MKKTSSFPLLAACCLMICFGCFCCSNKNNKDEPPVIKFADNISQTDNYSYVVSVEITSVNDLKEVRIEKNFPSHNVDDEVVEIITSFDNLKKISIERDFTIPPPAEKMHIVFIAVDTKGQEAKESFSFILPETFRQRFVSAISKAYVDFEISDKLPGTISINGNEYDKGKYYEIACRLLVNTKNGIADEISLSDFSSPTHPVTLDNFVEDEIPIELLVNQSQRQLSFAQGNNNVFANYVSYPQSFIGPQGEKYNGQLSFDRSAVILARAFANYREHNEFPAKLSSWHSDFCHSTLNCDIADNVVITTLNSLIKGKSTNRQKAEAIFYYVRNHVAYDFYYDTKYGASSTLTGKIGNCCDISHALVAMARAAGIPARYVHADATYPSGNTFGHVWMEMYIDSDWYLCDATGKQNTFGNHENWTTYELRSKLVELYF